MPELYVERGEVVLLVSDRERGLVKIARDAYRAMPPFDPGSEEQQDASNLALMARLVDSTQVPLQQRPFRAPHHTVSDAGMIGSAKEVGASRPSRGPAQYGPVEYRVYPGECSLAHGGMLLLDQVFEFRGSTLDATAAVLSLGYSEIRRGYSQGGWRFHAALPARPYAVVMTTTTKLLESAGRRYQRHTRGIPHVLGLVTREVRVDDGEIDLNRAGSLRFEDLKPNQKAEIEKLARGSMQRDPSLTHAEARRHAMEGMAFVYSMQPYVPAPRPPPKKSWWPF